MRTALSGLILAALALAACTVSPEGEIVPLPGFLSPAPSAAADAEGPAAYARQVGLAGGAVIVTGPPGYCVDTSTVSAGRGRGVAILASCSILSGGALGAAVRPALATVTVATPSATPILPQPQALASAAGAPLLSAVREDDLVLAQLGRGGEGVLAEGDARYWRGAFVLGPHLVALALYAPEGSALAGAEGATFLRETAAATRRASAVPRAPVSSGASGAGTGAPGG